MKNLFVPYEESWGLKELGFNESCFGTWRKNACKGNPFEYNIDFHTKVQLDNDLCPKNSDNVNDWTSAMTYSQAFKFLRDKYKLSCSIELTDNSRHYYFDFTIYDSKDRDWNDEDCFDSCKRLYSDGTYSTYEEAELECLKKLIEIVKNKLYD